jgi:hypothetical protein
MIRIISRPPCVSVLLALLFQFCTGCNDSKQESFDAALAQQNELLGSQQQQMQQMTATIEQLRVENQQAKARLDEAASRPPVINVQPPEIRVQPRVEYAPPPPPPPPPTKQVDLIIKSVTVYSDKDNGSPWDDSGPPDLKVRIVGGSGGSYTTSTQQDTTSATYNVKATRLAEGDEIEISVLDGDVFADDTIGAFTKQITADTMQSGTVNWTFGRVASLVLEFQP